MIHLQEREKVQLEEAEEETATRDFPK